MGKQVAAGLLIKNVDGLFGDSRTCKIQIFEWLNKPAVYLENRIYDNPINNVKR